MKKIKRFCLIIILLFFFLIFTLITYASSVSKDLENNIFRLHIIANSNSEIDQSLKLKVRDNIIHYLQENCDNCKSKSELYNFVVNHLEDLNNISQKTIYDNNFNYNVSIDVGNFYFPTKYYGNISLPAGFYDGIKINIGEAKGNNWWCSLFPPLCFTDISSGIIDENAKNDLKSNISNEEFKLISSSNEIYKFKFKIIEFLNHKNIL